MPVADTLKRAGDGLIAETVPRAGLFGRRPRRRSPFPCCSPASGGAAGATDDAAILEAAGHPVAGSGPDDNIKLTYKEDLVRLERAWRRTLPRVGTGFDVHALVAGRPLVLCGVAIPHDSGLAGHSDADVGIHALCDAIYGALAEGDIGRHFPPWRRPGRTPTARASAARGGRHRRPRRPAANADVTLICEARRSPPTRRT